MVNDDHKVRLYDHDQLLLKNVILALEFGHVLWPSTTDHVKSATKHNKQDNEQFRDRYQLDI